MYEKNWEKLRNKDKHIIMRWIKPIPEDYPKYSDDDISRIVIHNIDGKYSEDMETWLWCSESYHLKVMHIGKKHSMYGKHHSEEARRKMRDSHAKRKQKSQVTEQ